MDFIEFAAEARIDFVPAVDSTIALSTTVRKGDTPNVTETATNASPASFDPRWVLLLLTRVVDAAFEVVDSVVAFVTLLSIGRVRIEGALEELAGGRTTEIRLGISEEVVDANNLLWSSSLRNLGIILSVILRGLRFILSHPSDTFLVVSDDMVSLRFCSDDINFCTLLRVKSEKYSWSMRRIR
jgi:hypothetical protein